MQPTSRASHNVRSKRPGVTALIVLFIVFLLWGVGNVTPASARARAVIDPALAQVLNAAAPDQNVNVIVYLKDQLDPRTIRGRDRRESHRLVIEGLRNKSESTQIQVRTLLKDREARGTARKYTPLWIVNGVAVSAHSSVIDEMARLPSVGRIILDATISAPRPVVVTAASTEPNISRINAPALWNLGYYGQGIIVASMDTGVDYTHPDVSAQWRGGTDSWYDPYGQHAVPTDMNGHGTGTMSVMVGGSNGGTAIGVAPQAKWIAVKIFDDAGNATLSAIHQGFQWLLNPSGNAAAPNAPDIVNNSWSFNAVGCYLDFEPDLQSLVAAGITPIFAAGNLGPNSPSDVSPGNNPSAFAVGATDNTDLIASFSSRGPTSCGRSSSVTYPAVVAPGVNVRMADLYGLYVTASGTSFSSPEVAGGLALLLSAFPNLTVAQQENALISTAQDLGPVGADNSYGRGRIDLLSAYNAIANGNAATATPALSTATPTRTTVPPTATPTRTTIPPTATNTPTRTRTPTPTMTRTPLNDSIFADGFESGNFSAWSAATTNGGRLSVTTNAAMVGTFGMQAVINNTTPMYVSNTSPTAETSYHARFYFNPQLTVTGSGGHNILIALNGNNSTVFRVMYRLNNGQTQVRASVTRSGGTSNTSWVSINPNAANYIEVAWQSSSNATLQLYTNGTLRQTLTGLNTSSSSLRVETVRLGPSGSLSGASGTEFYDAFASTRTTYIGTTNAR